MTAEEVWASYRGNLTWLKDRTLVLMIHGSTSYGTNTANSDIDVKGVAVAPMEYTHGFLHTFEQADKGFTDLDCTIFELRKWMKLASDNNPNVVELLFTEPRFWLQSSELWERIYGWRELFLSKNCKHRFSGYAISQLKRIRSHREWLLNPPKAPPTRAEFGLPEFTSMSSDQRQAAEAQVKKQVEAWNIDLAEVEDGPRIALLSKYRNALEEIASYSGRDIEDAAGRKLGFSENFLEYLTQERGYRGAVAHWKQYQEWKENRNEKRSELEAKYGYDCKHGYHLVRLMRMAKEILEGKGCIVHRPDHEELLAIRNGAWTYDQLIEWSEEQEKIIDSLMITSTLRNQPNRVQLNWLCVDVMNEMA